MAELTIDGDALVLQVPFGMRHDAKRIPGYRWDQQRKAWRYPVSANVVAEAERVFPGMRVAPDVLAAVQADRDRAAMVDAAKAEGWERATPTTPMPLVPGITPFQHQVLGYNIASELPASALLMEMGTGKTLTTVAVIGRRYLDGILGRVLILAPSSVVPVWPREFALGAFPTDVRALEGPVAKRKRVLAEWDPPEDVTADVTVFGEVEPRTIVGERAPLQVAVTNYEATWRMRDELVAWLAADHAGGMVVADESQRIKTPGAAQSKAVQAIGKRARFRMILTGTPVTQHPMDFFSQYKFLDPTIFGNSFATFKARYAVLGGFEGREIVQYRDLQDLVRRAHSIAYRVTKDEALDLPPFTDVDRFCQLDGDGERVYKRVLKDSVAELEAGGEITAPNVLTRLLRLQQITGGWVHDDEGNVSQVSRAKLNLLEEVLDETRGKVVVFARFREEVRAIHQMLVDRGADPSLVWGDTPMHHRGEQVRRFQEEEGVRAFVAQIQTAGLGITLTAASTAIYYSLDFSFANYDQARARLHRIGQTANVTNVHLLAKGTVDLAVMAALKRKRNVADAVTNRDWKNLFDGRETIHVDEFARG